MLLFPKKRINSHSYSFEKYLNLFIYSFLKKGISSRSRSLTTLCKIQTPKILRNMHRRCQCASSLTKQPKGVLDRREQMTNSISTRLKTGRRRRKDVKSPDTDLNAVVLVKVERVVFVDWPEREFRAFLQIWKEMGKRGQGRTGLTPDRKKIAYNVRTIRYFYITPLIV